MSDQIQTHQKENRKLPNFKFPFQSIEFKQQKQNFSFLLENMRILLLILSLTLTLTLDSTYTFEQYITDFHKLYHSEEQSTYRRSLFLSNLQTILQLNSQNNPYTLSPNQFTDQSDEQKQTFLTAPIDLRVKASKSETLPIVSAPNSWDWRHYNKVTAVKTQGSCGSCWVFSSVAAYQSLLAIKTGQEYDLSEEYVLECAGQYSNCWGGFVSDANLLLINKGTPLQSQFPYLAQNSKTNTPSTPNICSTPTTIKLPVDTLSSPDYYTSLSDEQMYGLIWKSPIVALVGADIGFMSYRSGVYECAQTTTASMINHAVSIVGYDKDGNYIVKNSWGSYWGYNGFGVISKKKDCGLKLFVYQINNTAANQQLVYNNTVEDFNTPTNNNIDTNTDNSTNTNNTTNNNTNTNPTPNNTTPSTPNNTTPNNTTPNKTSPSNNKPIIVTWAYHLATYLSLYIIFGVFM